MIKFTNLETGKNVYINPDLVTAVYPHNDRTYILLTGNEVVVKELEDEVIARFYGQQLNRFTRTGDYSRL